MSVLNSGICQMSTAVVNPWDMLNNFCFYVLGQMWLFVLLSYVIIQMFVVVDPWDTLNNLCFHVYAQMFIGENDNGSFLAPCFRELMSSARDF